MQSTNTKEAFHKFIDSIDDDRKLKSYLDLVKRLNANESGEHWRSLNKDEQEQLLISHRESFDDAQLLDHDEVKLEHAKWLEK